MDRTRQAARMAAHPEVASMGTSREIARMAARREVASMGTSWEAVRSQRLQAVAGRRQPLEPHNLAHKMRGESQSLRHIRR